MDEEDEDKASKKRKNPALAARLKRRRTIDMSAVKMTLNRMCLNKPLLQEIDICVHGVTRVCLEASRFLNYYILTLLEKNDIVPELNETFFYSAFTLIAGSSRAKPEKFGTAYETYSEARPVNMEKFDYRHVAQILHYSANEYLVACKNHVVLNIGARVAKAFNIFFRTL